MNRPENMLAPREKVFSEPWHAQALATAYALVNAGHITASDWAQSLGDALSCATESGMPDTEETYYLAVLQTLEQIAPIDEIELSSRKTDWENAYRNTPHGKPVVLGA